MKDKRKHHSSQSQSHSQSHSSSSHSSAMAVASSDHHSSSRLLELKIPSMSTPLQQAVFRGCVECIQVLVETPPYLSVDAACGPEGLRPIHIAAREGHINTLRYLTNAGACILKSDYHGSSALHHAAIGGQVRAVRWLLRHGAELSLDSRGRSPIQVAADNDHLEIVSLLAKNASRSSSNLIVPSSILKSSSSRRATGSPSTTTTIAAASTRNYQRLATAYGHPPTGVNSRSSHAHSHAHAPHTISGGHKHKSKSNHLICDKTEAIIHESSSSGNSSLATLSNSPSLSPSSATTSCASCLSSSESSSAEEKSGLGGSSSVEEPDTYGRGKVKNANAEATSPAPFFLHPPKSSIASPKGEAQNPRSHKRQSSFYLHPPTPSSIGTDSSIATSSTSASTSTTTICSSVVHFADEDSDIEIQETSTVYDCSDSNNSGTMAPVTPNGATDFIPPRGEHIEHKNASDSSPPPTPARNGVSKLPVRNFNGLKNGNGLPSTPAAAGPVNPQKSSTAPGILRKGIAPPPPPPPPMPKFDEPVPHQLNLSSVASTLKSVCRQNNQDNDDYSVNGEENDYEDIDDIQAEDHRKTMESNKRLNRSVSAPAGNSPNGTLTNSNSTTDENNNNRSAGENGEQVKNPAHHIAAISAKIYGIDGKPRVPFIPPNFPDPPKDALIKPSEYLKSIQQSKLGLGRTYNTNGGNGVGSVSSASSPSSSAASSSSSTPTSPSVSPISKVEECIKMLSGNSSGGSESGSTHHNHNHHASSSSSSSPMMQPLAEEANVEDEHEEINPERINGSNHNHAHNHNGDVNNGHTKVNRVNGGGGKLKFSNLNGNYSSDGNNQDHNSNGGISSGRNGIKSDELSKVQLRKTPTSRTVSAPVLGRVLPDKPTEPMYIGTESCSNNNKSGAGTANGSGAGASPSTAIIAELTESSQVGGVREWKEELRRRQIEQDKAAAKELEQVYSPLNFVAEVPSTDVSGAPIPPWKRQMIAKKVAEKARKEAEEQRRQELEAKRVAAIPPWRRQLLQRRESTTEGKYT